MNNWKEEICIFIAWRKSALDYSQHHQRQILNDYNFACYRKHFNFVITCGISLWHLSSKLHVVLNKSIEIADFYFWVFLSHFAVCIKFIAQCFFSILLNNSIHYWTQFFLFSMANKLQFMKGSKLLLFHLLSIGSFPFFIIFYYGERINEMRD